MKDFLKSTEKRKLSKTLIFQDVREENRGEKLSWCKPLIVHVLCGQSKFAMSSDDSSQSSESQDCPYRPVRQELYRPCIGPAFTQAHRSTIIIILTAPCCFHLERLCEH